MSQSGGSEKAYFTHDDYGAVFHVQYNPKEFKFDEAVAWKDSKEFSVWKPLVEFDRGKPASLSMELIFDTTDTGDNVDEKWVSKIRAFLAVNVPAFANEKLTLRAPYCTFCWGSYEFAGVVESLGVSYLMFKTDGTPLRAKVSVKMKERNDDIFLWAGNDSVVLSAPVSMFRGGGASDPARAQATGAAAITSDGSAAAERGAQSDRYQATTQATGFTGVTTYTVQEGDTLSGIALKLGIEFWWLAAANNVRDPLNLEPGTQLVVPPNAPIAGIFAARPSGGNWNWGDYDPQLNQDSDLADIFAIYDGSWDPFAEQDLEALGGEVGMAGEQGAGAAGGAWAMTSSSESNPPEASTFEHKESSDAAALPSDSGSRPSGGGRSRSRA
jgi:LysM repeat protein